jgi:hypothetical protein
MVLVESWVSTFELMIERPLAYAAIVPPKSIDLELLDNAQLVTLQEGVK